MASQQTHGEDDPEQGGSSGAEYVERDITRERPPTYEQAIRAAQEEIDEILTYFATASERAQELILSVTDNVLGTALPPLDPVRSRLPKQVTQEVALFSIRLLKAVQAQSDNWLEFSQQLVRKIEAAMAESAGS